MSRWQKDSGEGRLTPNELHSFSTRLLRRQVREQPPPVLKETIERAVEKARRWPRSYLAKELHRIYGVKL